jgi:hypothetical protein
MTRGQAIRQYQYRYSEENDDAQGYFLNLIVWSGIRFEARYTCFGIPMRCFASCLVNLHLVA